MALLMSVRVGGDACVVHRVGRLHDIVWVVVIVDHVIVVVVVVVVVADRTGGGVASGVASGVEFRGQHDTRHLGLVRQVADDLDGDVVEAVWRLVAVVWVCPQGPDLVEQEIVFRLKVLDILGGLGQNVGLVEAGRRRQALELVKVDFIDVVQHAERRHGVLQLDELSVNVCAVLLLDLVV